MAKRKLETWEDLPSICYDRIIKVDNNREVLIGRLRKVEISFGTTLEFYCETVVDQNLTVHNSRTAVAVVEDREITKLDEDKKTGDIHLENGRVTITVFRENFIPFKEEVITPPKSKQQQAA